MVCLNRLLETRRPRVIIELGTGTGASANFFAWHSCYVERVYTFDKQTEKRLVTAKNTVYRGQDIFDGKTIGEIEEIVQKNAKCLIFCDNGDKRKEFAIYSGLLKENDLIAVHDFGTEIQLCDLKPYIDQHSLKEIPCPECLIAAYEKIHA